MLNKLKIFYKEFKLYIKLIATFFYKIFYTKYLKNKKIPKNGENSIALMTVFIMKENILFMEEWIKHHINLGVNHFFLYDNSSVEKLSDWDNQNYKQVIIPGVKNKHNVDYSKFISDEDAQKLYQEIKDKYKDKITVINWDKKDEFGFVRYFQEDAVFDFVNNQKDNYEYGIHIDMDEFLISRYKNEDKIGLNLKDIVNIMKKNKISTGLFYQRRFQSRHENLDKKVLAITRCFDIDESILPKSIFDLSCFALKNPGKLDIHKIKTKYSLSDTKINYIDKNLMMFYHYHITEFNIKRFNKSMDFSGQNSDAVKYLEKI